MKNQDTEMRRNAGRGGQRMPANGESRRDTAPRRNSHTKKRRRRGSNILIYIMLTVILAGVGVALSLTVFFRVSDIKVTGTEKYNAEKIIEASGLKKDVNIFMTDTKAAEKRIETTLPYVQKATIKRSLPNTLKITVTQARIYAAFKLDNGYAMVNDEKKVLEITDKTQKGMLLIQTKVKKAELGDSVQLKDKKTADALKEVERVIKLQKLKDITEIRILDAVSIKLIYQNRIILDIGTLTDIEKKLMHAAKALEKIDKYDEGTLDLKWWTSSNPDAYLRRHSIDEEDVTGTESNVSSQTNSVESASPISSSAVSDSA